MKTTPDTTGIEEIVKDKFYRRFSDKAYPKQFTDIVNEVCKDFSETHHQQLQKARADERERIYSLQEKCRERNLFSHRNCLCVCYKSELNQDSD